MNQVRSGGSKPGVVPNTTPPKGRGRPSRWHAPLWWLNIAAAVVLLITYLAPHVNPVHSWIPSVLALAFIYQLVVHGAFLVWWWFFRRKRMLLSGALLLLGFGHIKDHIQVFGRTAPAVELRSKPVKLMSYNVRLFNLYEWNKDKRTRDAIFEVLQREDPDILCLQEFFYSRDKQFFPTKQSLLKDFRFRHSHERYTAVTRYDQHFGIATFSSHPITQKGHIAFPGKTNNQCIWSDIAIGQDTVRLYNAHIASYHFGDEDYKFLKDLKADTDTDTLKQGGERILKRLRRGLRLRANEVQLILDHMRSSPHPVLYCGDMNDVPMSYGYNLLRELLSDAFVESGRGVGGTYIGDLPSLRIDHILYGDGLHAWNFRTLADELSDHRTITAEVALVAR